MTVSYTLNLLLCGVCYIVLNWSVEPSWIVYLMLIVLKWTHRRTQTLWILCLCYLSCAQWSSYRHFCWVSEFLPHCSLYPMSIYRNTHCEDLQNSNPLSRFLSADCACVFATFLSPLLSTSSGIDWVCNLLVAHGFYSLFSTLMDFLWQLSVIVATASIPNDQVPIYDSQTSVDVAHKEKLWK